MIHTSVRLVSVCTEQTSVDGNLLGTAPDQAGFHRMREAKTRLSLPYRWQTRKS